MSIRVGHRSVPTVPVALTVALLAIAVWCVIGRALAPSDGTTINVGDSAVADSAVVIQQATDGSALHAGDVLLAIDGTRVNELASRPLGGPSRDVGDTLAYRIERDGTQLTVPVTLTAFGVGAALLTNWATLLVILLIAITSGAIFWARPRDPASRAAVITSAVCVATTAGSAFFPVEALDLAAGWQFWRWYAGEIGFTVLWAGMLHFALTFPSIRRPQRFRRQLAVGYLGGLAIYGVTAGVAVIVLDNPIERLAIAGSPVLGALFVYPPVILAVLVYNYVTNTDRLDRRRLRWLAGSLGGGAAAYLAIWALPLLITGEPLLPMELHALAFLPVPVAVAVAVLREQALNIEVAISRTFVYFGLTLGIVALYAGLVGLLSLVFDTGDAVWQQALAVAAVAILVQPLRVRLQAVINKRFFGEHSDPYRVVSRLAAGLQNTSAPGETLPAMVETIASALRLPHVAIEIETMGAIEQAASVGTPGDDVHRMPLAYRGERVGYLVVTPRTPVLRRRDRAALAEVARHAGVAVYTERLNRDLRRSRDRLARAREKERRRLLNDLHDGLGPTLAAIGLGLDASRQHLGPTDPTGLLLGRLSDELQGAIGEIRRLAHGLRPPVLDRVGLVPAIREYAGALASRSGRLDGSQPGVNVVLEVPTVMPRLPASVDVAAYRIVCEALTNVSRHAHANACAVRLWIDDDLHIEVVDDGVGLPDARNGGIGLWSMRERAAELGGDCVIEQDHAGGTRVFATLPLPRNEPAKEPV